MTNKWICKIGGGVELDAEGLNVTCPITHHEKLSGPLIRSFKSSSGLVNYETSV